MNRQEIFDTVWNHFIVKRRKLSSQGSSCKYRSNGKRNGAKCGIGCLIPDKDYSPDMDNLVLTSMRNNSIVQKVLRKIGINVKRNMEFLVDIQTAHDNAVSLKQSIKDNLITLAKKYKLKAPK